MQRFAHGDDGAPSWGSPEWAARREVEVLRLLCDDNVAKMQQLWLRKQGVVAGSRQQAGGQPRPQQQSRPARKESAPVARPKQQTQAQAARRARSQKQLRQKHLASKLWACVRVAARLQAWRVRATCIGEPTPAGQAERHPLAAAPALFGAEGRFWSVCGAYRRVPQHRLLRKVLPASFSAVRPAIAGPLGVGMRDRRMGDGERHASSPASAPPASAQRLPTALTLPAPPPANVLGRPAPPGQRIAGPMGVGARDRRMGIGERHAGSPASASPASAQRLPTAPTLPAPPPASLRAAPAPPGQHRLASEQLVVAARANLDESEMQDHRGSKRDATARTPPPKSNPSHLSLANQLQPPPPGPKKSRGGAACNAALAAAAPPPAAAATQQFTATTYAAAALAAANPHHLPHHTTQHLHTPHTAS